MVQGTSGVLRILQIVPARSYFATCPLHSSFVSLLSKDERKDLPQNYAVVYVNVSDVKN